MSDTIDIQMINFLADSLKQIKSSESQDLKSLEKVFKGKKMSSITPFLMTGPFFNSAPDYNSSIDYISQSNELWTELNYNLECLKEECVEKNWLQSMSQIIPEQSQGQEEDVKDKSSVSYRRRRRSDEELKKDEICPFVGCDKTYSSKSSLKLHMKRNHTDSDIIKEDFNKPFPVMNQFKKGVDLNRVFKKEYIPEIARKASKNCKFSGKYFEELTNSSTINSLANTQIPQNTKVENADNWFFPDGYLDNDDCISNNPQFFCNNEEELWSDAMIVKNLEETIMSVQKEIKTLEKRDITSCFFDDEEEDEDLGSKFLKVDCSGPNFGFCINEKSPAFMRIENNGVKKLNNNLKGFNTNSMANQGCFFDDDCLSLLNDEEETNSPIHKLGSKRNVACNVANELF